MFGRYAFAKAPFGGQGSNAYTVSLSEGFTSTDSSTQASTFITAFSDGFVSNDTNAEQDVFYFGNVDAILTMADTNSTSYAFTYSTTENFNPTDSFFFGFSLDITEDFTPADIISNTANVSTALTETLTSLDSYAASFNYLASLTEPTTIGDINSEADILYLVANELVYPADSSTQQTNYQGVAITENFNPSDIIVITAQFQGSVTEALTSAETISASNGFSFFPVENFGSSDKSTQVCVFYASFSDSVSVLDSLATHGWSVVRDVQAVSVWTPINDAQ